MLVGAGTSFEAGSSNSVAFEKTLTIHEGAEADIKSRHISIDELKFHGNGGLASLAVLPEGSLSFSRPVTVKDGAELNISLGRNSRLTGAVFTDDQTGSGGSFISLGAGSVWQNAMHSNVTELKVSEGAVIEVGSEKGFRPLQIFVIHCPKALPVSLCNRRHIFSKFSVCHLSLPITAIRFYPCFLWNFSDFLLLFIPLQFANILSGFV